MKLKVMVQGEERECYGVLGINQSLGDIVNFYERCGSLVFGRRLYCPDCAPNGPGCGKHFVYHTERSDPDIPSIILASGEEISVDSFEIMEG